METHTIRIIEVENRKFVAEVLQKDGTWFRLTVPCHIKSAISQASLEISARFGFVD